MENSIGSRFKNAWNALIGSEDANPLGVYQNMGVSHSYRPDRARLTRGNERSIVTSVYNRLALDVAAINVTHARLDNNNRMIESIESGLNNCLNISANIDQTGRSFIQDVVMSMLDEGCIAIVPVDTSTNPIRTASFDIYTLRVAKILEWYPSHVRVEVYNDKKGVKETIMLPKHMVAIVENPLYSVINEPNSTMQRLVRKLNLLDVIDEQSGSGKLDLIIQLPYIIKTDAKRQQAEERRKSIEMQLSGSKYGIAYTDGTERVTQLNRPVENKLMSQIEFLTSMLYSQLGITQSILDGSANEATMLNYYNRTIEPIISAIVDEMKRKFLTKTARSQKQTILFFRDPFKLVPVGEISEIADKFTRNEIMSSNEIRQIIGMKPAEDPKADELRNKNLSQAKVDIEAGGQPTKTEEEFQNGKI
jgi:Phage portal protein.